MHYSEKRLPQLNPQTDKPSAVTKKMKTNVRTSKVVQAIDSLDVTSGNSVNEPPDDNENNESPITGRQRGAKNYSIAELTLLSQCMEAAVPIGPDGVGDAISLYKRFAGERCWAERGDKALRQKWEKVRTLYVYVPCKSLLPLCHKAPDHPAKNWGLR